MYVTHRRSTVFLRSTTPTSEFSPFILRIHFAPSFFLVSVLVFRSDTLVDAYEYSRHFTSLTFDQYQAVVWFYGELAKSDN